jgi:ABC-type dipeptide/oligopeptide/nickel transport system permease subunit
LDKTLNKPGNEMPQQENGQLTLREERSLKIRKVFRRIPKTAAVIILLLLVCAIFSPWIAPHDPIKQDLANSLKPPCWQQGGSPNYILGTDNLGRDILSRIVYGARVSTIVGIFRG